MKILVLISSLFLFGCDSNEERREFFQQGKYYKMLHQETGTVWLLKHHIGSNYSVEKCIDLLPKDSCKITEKKN